MEFQQNLWKVSNNVRAQPMLINPHPTRTRIRSNLSYRRVSSLPAFFIPMIWSINWIIWGISFGICCNFRGPFVKDILWREHAPNLDQLGLILLNRGGQTQGIGKCACTCQRYNFNKSAVCKASKHQVLGFGYIRYISHWGRKKRQIRLPGMHLHVAVPCWTSTLMGYPTSPACSSHFAQVKSPGYPKNSSCPLVIED